MLNEQSFVRHIPLIYHFLATFVVVCIAEVV